MAQVAILPMNLSDRAADFEMKRTIIAGIVTLGLVLWAHQLPTIGGRVPMVFVALWFGSATMVALIFSMDSGNPHVQDTLPRDVIHFDL
jgi:hypothetical protein